jgi:enoyl-CoA hydratase/carnithine racemase
MYEAIFKIVGHASTDTAIAAIVISGAGRQGICCRN